MADERGRGTARELGGHVHEVDLAAAGERGEPALQDLGPHRTEPGRAGRPEAVGDRPAGPAVGVALLVEQHVGAGQPAGGAARRAVGGAVERDPGQRRHERLAAVHQDGAAES
jgi:hypothetical protein